MAAAKRKRAKRFVETPEYAGAIARMAKALRHRVGQEDPSSLRYLVAAQDALDGAWRGAVDDLRSHGFSDREIGEALNVTQQAVNKRWPQRVTE